VGQYLRPSKDHLPIARFYTPEEFRVLKEQALHRGFRHVESGPLARSSYHAHEQAQGSAIITTSIPKSLAREPALTNTRGNPFLARNDNR
jgi:hypothetical protein